MNDLGAYANIFADSAPINVSPAPPGYVVDFLGNHITVDFVKATRRTMCAGLAFEDVVGVRRLPPPALGSGVNGESWFETVNWFVAAREARERFVMATLGAFFGYQAVGCSRALALLNPMPCTLVCVEPVPQKMAALRRHFRDNGIDPARHWLSEAAIGASNEPVLFPVGAPMEGGHNSVATNDPQARQDLLRTIGQNGRCEQVLTALLLRNSTGMTKDLAPDGSVVGEIKFVSCVTLQDILGPFDFVDYVEADLQQSETVVFPPYINLLRRKVRRIHIGTHGADAHALLLRLFGESGWTVVFNYPPDTWHDSPIGAFSTNDGILTFRNPDL
jgi:hypothetical protein